MLHTCPPKHCPPLEMHRKIMLASAEPLGMRPAVQYPQRNCGEMHETIKKGSSQDQPKFLQSPKKEVPGPGVVRAPGSKGLLNGPMRSMFTHI